jgi:hypothetical protein
MRFLLATFVVLGASGALAQHPGHLGKPPPSHPGGKKPIKIGELPRWPRKADPQPMRTTQYLDIKVRLRGGKLGVLGVRKGKFPAGPTLIRRFRGRFVVKLYTHGLLRDVVRFDMPLTGAAENRAGTRGGTALGDRLGLGLAKGVSATTSVRVPFDERITGAVIHDSVSGKNTRIDLSSVVSPQPRPKVPGNLRTRSIGKASPKTLDDCLVLFKGKPKRIRDCEKKVRRERARKRQRAKAKRLEDEKILKGR